MFGLFKKKKVNNEYETKRNVVDTVVKKYMNGGFKLVIANDKEIITKLCEIRAYLFDFYKGYYNNHKEKEEYTEKDQIGLSFTVSIATVSSFFNMRFLNLENGERTENSIIDKLFDISFQFICIESIHCYFYVSGAEFSEKLIEKNRVVIDNYGESVAEMAGHFFADVPQTKHVLDYLTKNENDFDNVKFKIAKVLVGSSVVDNHLTDMLLRVAHDIKEIPFKTKMV